MLLEEGLFQRCGIGKSCGTQPHGSAIQPFGCSARYFPGILIGEANIEGCTPWKSWLSAKLHRKEVVSSQAFGCLSRSTPFFAQGFGAVSKRLPAMVEPFRWELQLASTPTTQNGW